MIEACYAYRFDDAMKLLDADPANAKIINEYGNTPLFTLACSMTDITSKKLQESAHALLDRFLTMDYCINHTREGYSILHDCIFTHASCDVVSKLINAGCDPAQLTPNNSTPLIMTCHNPYQTNIALLLLNTGMSNYAHIDSEGHDALYYAKENNLHEVVERIEQEMDASFVLK